jgi:hypothetical protein
MQAREIVLAEIVENSRKETNYSLLLYGGRKIAKNGDTMNRCVAKSVAMNL